MCTSWYTKLTVEHLYPISLGKDTGVGAVGEETAQSNSSSSRGRRDPGGGGTRGEEDENHGEEQRLLQGEEGTEVQADLSTEWPLERKGMWRGQTEVRSGHRLLWKPETTSQTERTARSWERGCWAKVLQDGDLDETALKEAAELNLTFSSKGTISSSAIRGDKPHI